MYEKLDALQTKLLEILKVGAVLSNNYDKVEIQILAGAGGLSAGMSVKEQYELYLKFINYMGWVIESEEIDRHNEKELGYSRVQLTVAGHDIIQYMEYEKGVHRIQGKGFILSLTMYRGVGIPRTKGSKKLVRGIPTLSGEFQRCPGNSNAIFLSLARRFLTFIL